MISELTLSRTKLFTGEQIRLGQSLSIRQVEIYALSLYAMLSMVADEVGIDTVIRNQYKGGKAWAIFDGETFNRLRKFWCSADAFVEIVIGMQTEPKSYRVDLRLHRPRPSSQGKSPIGPSIVVATTFSLDGIITSVIEACTPDQIKRIREIE
jgi:hypothetical protein